MPDRDEKTTERHYEAKAVACFTHRIPGAKTGPIGEAREKYPTNRLFL